VDIYKFTEKLENGKYRIRESFSAWEKDSSKYVKKLRLTESRKVIENEGVKHNVLLALEVPVWRLDQKNLNGRTYPYELGELVCDQNLTTVNLKDHPEGEGSVDDIIAISNNPHIRDGILYVDSYYVDEDFSKKVSNILKVPNAELGVSSSVFADLSDDGHIIIDGFEMERYWDQVLNPSYQVYVSNESKKIENKSIDSNKIIKENKTKNRKKGNIMENKEVNLYDDIIREDIEKKLKEALSLESINEKITKLEYYLDGCKNDDILMEYVDEIEGHLSGLYVEYRELADKGTKTDLLEKTLNVSEKEKTKLMLNYESLKEKYDFACEELDKIKNFANNLRKITKSLKETINDSVSKDKYFKLKKGFVSLSEDFKELEKENSEIYENFEKIVKISKKKEGTIKNSDNKIKELKVLLNKLHVKNEDLNKQNKKLSKINENLEYKLYSIEEDIKEKELMKRKAIEDKKRKEAIRNKELKAKKIQEEQERIRKETNLTFYEDTKDEVKEYYLDMVKIRPSVVNIKEELLNCKNLRQAQNLYFKLDSKLEKYENTDYEVESKKIKRQIENLEDRNDQLDEVEFNHTYKDMKQRMDESVLFYEEDSSDTEYLEFDWKGTGEKIKFQEEYNGKLPDHLEEISDDELEELKF
jgi:hypothetical protein